MNADEKEGGVSAYLLMPRDEVRPGDLVRLDEGDSTVSPQRVISLTEERLVVLENEERAVPVDRIRTVIRLLPI